MGHIQHLSFESLVKMGHFQKEPPLNLKGTTEAQGGRKGPVPTILKEQIGNPAQTECPLWVIRDRIPPQCRPMSAVTLIADKRWCGWIVRFVVSTTHAASIPYRRPRYVARYINSAKRRRN